MESSHLNLVADAELPSLSASINNSQQNLLPDDRGTIHPPLNDIVTNQSSDKDKDKSSNVQTDQEPKVTKTTRSGRQVKPPSRFSDFVSVPLN